MLSAMAMEGAQIEHSVTLSDCHVIPWERMVIDIWHVLADGDLGVRIVQSHGYQVRHIPRIYQGLGRV